MVTEWVWAGVPVDVYYRHEDPRQSGHRGRRPRARGPRRPLARRLVLPRWRPGESSGGAAAPRRLRTEHDREDA
ncbi:hypothetical protein B0I33_10617 [Prauserella shujinwangii]|uniref:Uncharacterized protein n=1 Tax=Prauserella shujinwangii TaxID=1453103 RepID=A0A2T0LT60_9PSEU|nr:hypothetical protein [Prauserella shujinwangii]PRX46920.1 hypothetical protein B0I33_10617 [Prauserella shujinwangii]